VSHRQKDVWRNARSALFGLSLLFGSAALAQASVSVLTGNVVDAATKAPVGDVVVTATSPSMQGEQVVVTDGTGLYRIPQLPPGTYTLRFEKETFRPFSRTGIDVAADRTLRLNVELLPETAGATEISVVGSPPTVDVASSTTGSTVSQDFVRNLALSRPGALAGANRSFDSLAVTAPQASADFYGVGISGASSPENQYLINGLSVNDPAYGILGTPVTAEFIDEVNVVTGGYMPEYGRTTGGTISAVTKSGGNEFHGSIWGNFTPGSLTGAPGVIESTTGVINGRVEPGNVIDFGATLGGYIIKDKLWFFVGFQPSYTRNNYYKTFSYLNSAGDFVPIENSQQHRLGDQHSYNYIGKLTFLLSSDHRISLTVIGTPTGGGGGGYFPTRGALSSQDRAAPGPGVFTGGTYNAFGSSTRNDALDVVGELNSSFLDKRLLLDIRAGWHHQKDETLPPDGSGTDVFSSSGLSGVPAVRGAAGVGDPLPTVDDSIPQSVKDRCNSEFAAGNVAACAVTQYRYGGPGFMETLTGDSVQAKGVLTYLLSAAGHHVFKAGVDTEFAQYDHTKAYSGQTYLDSSPTSIDSSGALVNTLHRFTDLRGYGFVTGPSVTDFVRTPVLTKVSKRQTIGGFIQDSWSIMDKVTLNLGVRYDSVALKGDDGVVRIALNDQLSPRVGLVYDFTQQGRSKIFVNYGRYYENIPLDIADRELSVESGLVGRHPFAGCSPLTGAPQDAIARCDANTSNYGGFRGAFGPNRFWRLLPAPDVVPVDPDLKSPSNDEVVAGAEYEVLPNARLGATYTYRNLHRTVEDMSNDEANTYFIGNPGEGAASAFPKATRTYHAVTVNFSKTFADLWLAQASYTWSRLTGNYDGLFRPEDGQLDPNLNSTFDLKSLLLNQEGNLSADVTHRFKLYGAKEFVLAPVLSLTLGLSFNAASGTPINYLGAQELYGNSQAFILVRGSGGRLPWQTSFDARFAVNYRISKDSILSASVDAFNIFNSQRPTLVDQDYTFDTVGPIIGATNGSVPTQYGGLCPNGGPCAPGTGSLPRPPPPGTNVGLPGPDQQPIAGGAAINARWGKPTQYQAVRAFRFGVRFTF